MPFPIPEGMCYTMSCSVGSVLRFCMRGADTNGLQILNKPISRQAEELLTFPSCKQWPCNFNLLCFVGTSQDNSLKCEMWEFLQPGMWCHDYTSTQGRRGEAPVLSLGTCNHLWGPTYTNFLQPAKPGVENMGAEGPLELLKPIGKAFCI